MTKGVLWILLEKGGSQLVSFILFLVIARLLGPEAYGLAMLCFVVLALSSLLFAGMADSIVTLQLTAKKSGQLSTLFWTIFTVGIALGFICFLSADMAAAFFEESELASLLKWFSIVPVLLALQAIPQLMIMQQMDFHVYAIRTLVTTIVSGVIGIWLALEGYGAMALIIQQIVLYVFANMVLWYFIKWRPALTFQKELFVETLRPGTRMFVSNILTFTEQQIPRVFLGYFLGLVSVGFYSFAFRMRYALQDMLINPLFMVLFPALSEKNMDDKAQDKMISNIVFGIGLLIFPSITVAVITAPQYVPLLLGDKWIDAIPILQLLLGLVFVMPFIKLAEIICRVHNRMDLYLKGQFVLIGIGACLMFFASQHSLMMVGYVIGAITLAGVPLYFTMLSLKADIHLWPYFKYVWKSALASVVMAIAIIAFMKGVEINNEFIMFAVTMSVGGVTYLACNFVFQRQEIIKVIENYRGKI